MDVPKVAPPQAVDQLKAVLDSPEFSELIGWLEAVRWTGRPGYPIRAMVGMCLAKSLYAIPTWSRTCRLVAEHPGLQAVLGCVPSQWACYRFAKTLRTHRVGFLEKCIRDVLASLREQHPTMGEVIAIDASDMPAYAAGHEKHRDGTPRKPTDPTASWGYRSAISTRGRGMFFGYKVHAAVDVATDLPLAWTIQPANEAESNYAVGLIDKTRSLDFAVNTAIMDKGYDTSLIHAKCEWRHVSPVIPITERHFVKVGKARGGRPVVRGSEPPCCVHGEWTFAGSDYKRRATKWRCPTGECKAKSMWVKASRLRPLIPRETKQYHALYTQRGAVERAFGRLKHEWGLAPLRVRGRARAQLHADLTILACLASRLAADRARALPLAA